jgi:hypothetical protein
VLALVSLSLCIDGRPGHSFWFLQNKLRVLIAACDTFRSGAVEQLRVHVRNLRGAPP